MPDTETIFRVRRGLRCIGTFKIGRRTRNNSPYEMLNTWWLFVLSSATHRGADKTLKKGLRMPANGRVEVLSQDFAIGWAETVDGQPAHLHAVLGGDLIGAGPATVRRKDLDEIAKQGGPNANGFIMLFDREVDPQRVPDIEVSFDLSQTAIRKSPNVRIDRSPRLRVFILGSPRSGTSELGDTLARQLGLPWLGEGHAAPLFAKAADALSGSLESPNGLVRYMAQQDFRKIGLKAAQSAYYAIHGSSSFLDKTPGHPMIGAAPFLVECFPDAKFIFLQRNGISNVLSRMVKFGGTFETHCQDWATAMKEWLRVRPLLPHHLDVRQEKMLINPTSVATEVADYLDVRGNAKGIADSLQSGTRERTGAGIGRTSLLQTDWSEQQIAYFKRICGPMMEAFGYALDS